MGDLIIAGAGLVLVLFSVIAASTKTPAEYAMKRAAASHDKIGLNIRPRMRHGCWATGPSSS